MSSNRPNVLITGANGLIGSQFMKLPTQDINVVYTSRSPCRFELQDQFVTFDFTEIEEINHFLSRLNPDIIIHTAGVTAIEYAAEHETETQLMNVAATEEIVQWCKTNDRRLIFFSTDFVFDGTQLQYSEIAEPNPISIYGKSKALAEQVVLRSGIDAAVVRTSLVYGYNENLTRPNFPIWLMDAMAENSTLFITADQIRSPTFALDLAIGTLSLAKTEHRGVYHLAGPESMNVLEFAKSIAKYFDLDANKLKATTTSFTSDAARRPLQTALDISRATKDFGFAPRGIDEGLRALRNQMR